MSFDRQYEAMQDMRAFDTLPPKVRSFLRDAPVNLSAWAIKVEVDKHGADTVIAALGQQMRSICRTS